jgi:hypothetical protein
MCIIIFGPFQGMGITEKYSKSFMKVWVKSSVSSVNNLETNLKHFDDNDKDQIILLLCTTDIAVET